VVAFVKDEEGQQLVINYGNNIALHHWLQIFEVFMGLWTYSFWACDINLNILLCYKQYCFSRSNSSVKDVQISLQKTIIWIFKSQRKGGIVGKGMHRYCDATLKVENHVLLTKWSCLRGFWNSNKP
jgi:hypothetical protein